MGYDIRVGAMVVATKNGGHDQYGMPMQRPEVGKLYRVTSVYEMRYGLGCTLRGMDPFPYRGYFLYVKRPSRTIEAGWYFKPLEAADQEWTATLRELLGNKEPTS